MITLEQVSCIINSKFIFKDLSITLLNSSITILKGQNGSGKTSLLRMIAGIQKPSLGKIYIGTELLPIEFTPKPYCNYIGHNLAIKQETTVLENIMFWAKIYKSVETVDAAIHYFGLFPILNKKCYELSQGYQKRVAITRLLACMSDIWLLDEIETNLDDETKTLVQNLIVSKANNGGIVVMSSHNESNIKSAVILNIEDFCE